jgi:predicted nucleic acid-binding protein
LPVLNYLADTNSVSDYFRPGNPVRAWCSRTPRRSGPERLHAGLDAAGHRTQRRKKRLALEREFRFVLEDYREAIFVFDEAAAMEWGRLKAEARSHPMPLDDSYIAAIARVSGLAVVTRNAKHFPGCHTVNPWTGKETPPRKPS